MQVVLAVFSAGVKTQSVSIVRDSVVIGRRQDCQLRLAHSLVSRRHCRLVKEGGTLRIVDLGSTNGTFHNGQRVRDAILEAGDQVVVGPITFVVQIDGMPPDNKLRLESPGEADLDDLGTAFAIQDESPDGPGNEDLINMDEDDSGKPPNIADELEE